MNRGLAFFLEAITPIAVMNLGFSSLAAGPGHTFLASLVALAYMAWLAYFLVRDGWPVRGQSLGKRWRHAKVLAANGSACTIWQSVVRNIILIIPFVAWLEALLVLVRPDGRRLGDVLARTTVVYAGEK